MVVSPQDISIHLDDPETPAHGVKFVIIQMLSLWLFVLGRDVPRHFWRVLPPFIPQY